MHLLQWRNHYWLKNLCQILVEERMQSDFFFFVFRHFFDFLLTT